MQPGDIHAWIAQLEIEDRVRQDCWACLSDEERLRAAQYRFELHRRRFIASHGILRILLGRYLHCHPASVQFEIGNNGKPRLPDNAFEFNMAHSGDRALIAVTSGTPVGADLEFIREMPDALQIAARFFSPSESATLASLPADKRARAFFHCWTRKEAFVKAIGEGLAHPLDTFSVSLDSEARLLHLEGDVDAPSRWAFHHIGFEPDCVGAIAIRRQFTRLRLFRFCSDQIGPPE